MFPQWLDNQQFVIDALANLIFSLATSADSSNSVKIIEKIASEKRYQLEYIRLLFDEWQISVEKLRHEH